MRVHVKFLMGRLAAAIAALALFFSAAAPALGADIEAEDTVYAGLYSSEWNSKNDLDGLAAASGRRVTFAGSFHHLYENDPANPFSNTGWILDQAWQAMATPFANLEFSGRAAEIASGSKDGDIDVWAGHVQDWLDLGGGRSLIIAPLQEMNGDWTPYGCYWDGSLQSEAANYRAAFRRIVDRFQALGMDETKVRWAYAPNGWTTPGCGGLADFYPGDAYVDVIGISAYNFGGGYPNGWETVPAVYGPWLNELRTHVTAAKPYLLAQTGTSPGGGDKAQWVADMFSYAAADPNVVGLIYFNIDNTPAEPFWPVWTDPGVDPGWVAGVSAPTTDYDWPLTDWFQPGPLPFAGSTGPCPDGFDCDRVALVNASSQYRIYDRVQAGSPTTDFFYGAPGDVALMGDWNCDGTDTPAMYRPSNGFVYLRNSNDFGVADMDFFFGLAGDIPLAGDWDGDGCDTLGIYRPSEAKVYVRNTLGTGPADHEYFYGVPGDRPFAGDFDGDGFSTVGLYRESTGFVYFRNTMTTGVADFDFFYGAPEDRILAGDWDGDGDDTVAVYRPSTGTLYFRLTNSQGVADHTLAVGSDFGAALVAG